MTKEVNEKMTLFDFSWNLLLGISGGIISSIMVSRIFLIHSNFQNQINSFDLLLRKFGYINGMLLAIRAAQEVSYDCDVEMQNEMKQKGYKTENEYYLAHPEKDWISKERLINELLTECKKMNNTLKADLMNTHFVEKGLASLLEELRDYIAVLSSTKEITFSKLSDFEKRSKSVLNHYDTYRQTTGKKLLLLVLKDKVMICLYIFVVLILLLTIIAYIMGI